MNNVKLTDQELQLLDGKCSDEIQSCVDGAKKRIELKSSLEFVPDEFRDLAVSVVEEARKNGELVFQRTSARSCPCCKKEAGYAIRTRSGRYHRKGDKNYDKPLSFGAVEFSKRFVRMKHYLDVGCCADCFVKAEPYLKDCLSGVVAEIPKQLRLEGMPVHKKFSNKKCSKCEWEGHEGEMGSSMTLMGDGKYPSTCPKCNAKNTLFETVIKTVDGYVCLPVKKEGAK